MLGDSQRERLTRAAQPVTINDEGHRVHYCTQGVWLEALRDEAPDVSAVSWKVWVLMSLHSNWKTGEGITRSQTRLAEEQGHKRDTVVSALKQARDMGWLSRVGTARMGQPSTYRLSIPATVLEDLSEAPPFTDDERPSDPMGRAHSALEECSSKQELQDWRERHAHLEWTAELQVALLDRERTIGELEAEERFGILE